MHNKGKNKSIAQYGHRKRQKIEIRGIHDVVSQYLFDSAGKTEVADM